MVEMLYGQEGAITLHDLGLFRLRIGKICHFEFV